MNHGTRIAATLVVTLLVACKPAPDVPAGQADVATTTEVPAQATDAGQASSTAGAGDAIALAGMFRYLADAALFRDCRSNRLYPVAMEGAYKELESAYLNSGIDAGDELMVEIEGRFLERPEMDGDGTEVQLVVASFTAILPQQTACQPAFNEELANTYWKLTGVGGQVVKTPENHKEAHMILSSTEGTVKGHAGCNDFFGSWETEGESLVFSQMGSTMMACLEGMDTEQALLEALGSANRYTISGTILELYQDEQLLARFEAVHL